MYLIVPLESKHCSRWLYHIRQYPPVHRTKAHKVCQLFFQLISPCSKMVELYRTAFCAGIITFLQQIVVVVVFIVCSLPLTTISLSIVIVAFTINALPYATTSFSTLALFPFLACLFATLFACLLAGLFATLLALLAAFLATFLVSLV